MAGIVGVLHEDERKIVKQMLQAISHRGNYRKEIFEFEDATIGMVWSLHENESIQQWSNKQVFRDGPGHGHLAQAAKINGRWELSRDDLGVAPLYIAHTEGQHIMFASEVKALLPFSDSISELPPGHTLAAEGLKQNFILEKKPVLQDDPMSIAKELRSILSVSVRDCIKSDTMGSWLSGGLDSSTIAALARPYVTTLHTFAGGLRNAPDLHFANEVAYYIGSTHHQVIITLDSILRILPDVISQLESFDALLVRSSIVNLSVAYAASDYVSDVFSGEGGDELFAGYMYLKNMPVSQLEDELIDITGRLHNTALQRVDRSASAFGTTAHVVFTDPRVLDYALRIPVQYKMKDGIEKWILRKAMANFLPDSILERTKAKFWEGAGVGTILSEYASHKISDADFSRERKLKVGWILNSKEELYYYRIFREHFGEPADLSWMGRSKAVTSSVAV